MTARSASRRRQLRRPTGALRGLHRLPEGPRVQEPAELPVLREGQPELRDQGRLWGSADTMVRRHRRRRHDRMRRNAEPEHCGTCLREHRLQRRYTGLRGLRHLHSRGLWPIRPVSVRRRLRRWLRMRRPLARRSQRVRRARRILRQHFRLSRAASLRVTTTWRSAQLPKRLCSTLRRQDDDIPQNTLVPLSHRDCSLCLRERRDFDRRLQPNRLGYAADRLRPQRPVLQRRDRLSGSRRSDGRQSRQPRLLGSRQRAHVDARQQHRLRHRWRWRSQLRRRLPGPGLAHPM